MSDNGKELNQEQPADPQIILQVIDLGSGRYELKSSLPPQAVVYIFEEIKFNLFFNDKNQSSSILTSPHGGIMNFVRGRKKR